MPNFMPALNHVAGIPWKKEGWELCHQQFILVTKCTYHSPHNWQSGDPTQMFVDPVSTTSWYSARSRPKPMGTVYRIWKYVTNTKLRVNHVHDPVTKISDFFLRKTGGFQWSGLVWDYLEPPRACVNFFRISIASVNGKHHLSEVVFSALVGFSLLEKYPIFGQKQPEVAGSHMRKVRSLVNHRSLVFPQKSRNQVRGICWSIVVMEVPIDCWPQLSSLAQHSIT